MKRQCLPDEMRSYYDAATWVPLRREVDDARSNFLKIRNAKLWQERDDRLRREALAREAGQ